MPSASSSSPAPRFFGRRKGHQLSTRQEQLLQNTLPRLALAPKQLATLPKHYPASCQHFALDIGFGAGEHLLAQAQQNKQWGYLGAEVYVNGIASLLAKLDDTPLHNIRLFVDDARVALAHLPDSVFDVIYLLYPDPWHKTRHHKRRFVQSQSVQELYRLLKPSGQLCFASDDADYTAWALEHFLADTGFAWNAKSVRDWLTPPQGYVPTRYEQKTKAQGRIPTYLTFAKN